MDALRLPPPRRAGDAALRRREAPGGAVPDPPREARSAAPRRAHQPPRRRERGVAGAAPPGLRGHGGQHHPRPVLPGQRGGVDPRARPRRGRPLEGQLLQLAGPEAEAAGDGGEGRSRRGRSSSSGSWSGCGRAREGPPGEEQGPPRRVRGAARPQAPEKRDLAGEICIPPGPKLGDLVVEAQGRAQGLRRPAAHRGPELQAAAGRHRRASSAPTARARPRCSG